MEKLREAQTWLSTQTGGHLGQAMTSAFEGSGLMAKLEAKWGRNSLKFRSFSAAAANGLDFAINGFNSVVNAIALDQEVTDANILSLTSSLSAMAGDVTMGVTQIFTTVPKLPPPLGPSVMGSLQLCTLHRMQLALPLGLWVMMTWRTKTTSRHSCPLSFLRLTLLP